MVKYSYAIVDSITIHISNVTEESRKQYQYTCICCGEPMAAHINGKRKKHFQHYKNTQHDYETYLHITAKKIIKQAYENSLINNTPVYIEYKENRLCDRYKITTNSPCELGLDVNRFDITRTHKQILEEQPVGKFIPDLHLKSDNHPEIFIEIFVSHKSEVEKIKSGYRIIEISIKSEEDLYQLSKLDFSIKNKKNEYFNFKTKTVIRDFCSEDGNGCQQLHYYYAIHTNGGSYELGYDSLGYITGLINSYNTNNYVLRKDSIGDNELLESDIFRQLLNELRYNCKLNLKSCIECMHFYNKQYTNYPGTHMRCKKLMNDTTPVKAVYCNYYEVDVKR